MTNVRRFPERRRALIIGSTMGAGHMTAAHVLGEKLSRRGVQARVVDYLTLPRGPQGRLTRWVYRMMVRYAPAFYDWYMRGWMRHPWAFERIAAIGARAYARGLVREMRTFNPDVVVSTYNLAGQLLGRLRQDGRLRVPVAVYVTDAGAHPYWVAKGADLHLAPLQATAVELQRMGAETVEVVDPLIAPSSAATQGQARQALGLPARDFIVVVHGGSWGVGAVADAARCVASTGVGAYVLCGNAQQLSTAVSRLPGCRAIGWTDQVDKWLRAADVVIDSAGGTTCWEAIVTGTPVIIHRPLAGHGRLNASTLQAAGLVTVSWSEDELALAICRIRQLQRGPVLSVARERVDDRREPADLVEVLLGETTEQPVADSGRADTSLPTVSSVR